jgi:nucleotide-binding universal stress UspA family protein
MLTAAGPPAQDCRHAGTGELDMLQSVLVALDGSPYSGAATALALDWATRFGARLLGLGVIDKPSIDGFEAVPVGGTGFKKHRDDARMADAYNRVVEFLAEFRARCKAAGVACDAHDAAGEPARVIVREAQRSDLVMLGRETHFRFETQEQPDSTLGLVLRQSPRPVVVVPSELPDARGILVAYGGGREVARTLQTFQLLGLAAGEEITVVTVNQDGADAEAIAQRAADFLHAHGAPHRVRAVASSAPPADVLLEELRQRRPRLLVIGAHGYHPARDLFATSVTRAVLRGCAVPVFVGA